MAQLELSAEEARKLVEALRMVEIPWMDSGRDHDPLLAIRERADDLKFNIRACIVCGTEFEATNPRKQTCSDACRQALSRSKRDSKPSTAAGHKATVTEPVSKAPEMDFVADWGTLPSNASKRQWIAVVVCLRPDLTKSPMGVENFLGGRDPRTIAAIRKEAVQIGRMGAVDLADHGDGNDSPLIGWPQFRFLMNVETVEPFTAGFEVPAIAIELAQKYVREVHPQPEPQPTETKRSSFFEDPEYIAMQAKMTQQWDICKADAKVIGCKPDVVQRFKSRHKLPSDRPLSIDAQQLLRQELEHDQRSANGEVKALQARLQRLKERATPERLRAIDGTVETLPASVELDVAKIYLLEALADIGIKRRQKLVKGVWSDLENLIPYGKVFDFTSSALPDDDTIRRCLFWGAAIRLATLQGEPPQDIAEFLEWCGYAVHQSEQQRKTNEWWANFAQNMIGKPTVTSDRTVLDLPSDGELTAQAIKSAFKAQARTHHPDAGGDAAQFQRITEAKERLLLTV